MHRWAIWMSVAWSVLTVQAHAQNVGGLGQPWRGAGPGPCFGIDGGANKCPRGPQMVAIRAGRLFDSKSGSMLSNQVVLVRGDRITAVGPAAQIPIPAGTPVIDLSEQTVLPGLIDLHTHMFNPPKQGMTREMSTLIAVQNTQADLRAGFTAVRDMSTHGNGYADVDIRNAIDKGLIEGPRAQVSTRGIVWGAPGDTAPANPLASAVVHNAEEARAAVRDQISHGADWIKLFPAGAYSFSPGGEAQYVVTYPMPVLQALIDETHRLGHKTACHVYGGEGQKNAILAGCDSIEHAFGLTQDQANMMATKKLSYDPTLQRYTEPYMDDNDRKNTAGKYRMIPIFEKAVIMASNTKGLKITIGSGVDGSTFPHGTQALELVALVRQAHLSPARVLRAGTLANAEVLGWQDRIGSIEKGKFADIIALPGDPLADITDLERVDFVMKGGEIVRDDRRS
ncbi:MAG TPA: amidohydrolase family protein [Rhizomicrobium sp.]|nr:amidohydrolase family protein [Rhizomicrobium sp.]